jgi:tRNA threonylcarbamoyladenosine biosynthesis protein TsaE
MIIKDDQSMRALGARIGALLRGGEVFELVGDVGAGKTTLVKGLAAGLGVDDDVQSPSFTINRR